MKISDLSDNDAFNVKRIDYDRGFKIKLHLIDPETEKKYQYNTYLSVYVEDSPWTREELTNDKVIEAVKNLMNEVEEDNPELEFDGAEINEITKVREIKKL